MSDPTLLAVDVGNTNVTYEDLLKHYEYCIVDREAGRRQGAKRINRSGF